MARSKELKASGWIVIDGEEVCFDTLPEDVKQKLAKKMMENASKVMSEIWEYSPDAPN